MRDELSVDELKSLLPSARTLYWYLVATGTPQTIPTITAHSGLSRATVYEILSRHPTVFRHDVRLSKVSFVA